jgi:hypothetical protein
LTEQYIPDAYMAASANNTLPANARQVMYAARKLVLNALEAEGIEAAIWTDKTFTTQILPDFVRSHEVANDWDVVYDARGHLTEPHTRLRVPLGTRQVREYMANWTPAVPAIGDPFPAWTGLPTRGPAGRYAAVLYVEKEGFDEIIHASGILRRYDLALMSTKGTSVVAARALVEELSAGGVTVFALHDFDKTGFTICHTIGHDTDRHQFGSLPNVIDIGFRLEDVEQMGLESEPVEYKKQTKNPAIRLKECGATDEECAFLVREQVDGIWRGRRVELNAADSGQLIAHIERKLQEHGVRKVVPPAAELNRAFIQLARQAEAHRQAVQTFERDDLPVPPVPRDLPERVAEVLAANPEWPWDRAVIHIMVREDRG